MGSKPSNNFQSDRPESGGADHDEQREKSGLLERDKQEFAASQKDRQQRRSGDDSRRLAEKRDESASNGSE